MFRVVLHCEKLGGGFEKIQQLLQQIIITINSQLYVDFLFQDLFHIFA